jgi:hypothetical protein
MSALLDALRDFRKEDDPWREDYAEAMGAAIAALRSAVADLAETGDRDAMRVHDDLRTVDKVSDVCGIVGSHVVRLEADERGLPQPSEETAWCPECRRRRVVWDVDPHCSTYVGTKEIERTVTHLECGHELAGPERVIGPSPGGEAAAEAMAQDATRRRLDRAAAWNE